MRKANDPCTEHAALVFLLVVLHQEGVQILAWPLFSLGLALGLAPGFALHVALRLALSFALGLNFSLSLN